MQGSVMLLRWLLVLVSVFAVGSMDSTTILAWIFLERTTSLDDFLKLLVTICDVLEELLVYLSQHGGHLGRRLVFA